MTRRWVLGLAVLQLSLLAFPSVGRAACDSPGCRALKRVLAERQSGFSEIRGKVLFRRPDGQPGEYASKVKLPGAKSCTLEQVEKHLFYLCLFPSEPYNEAEAKFLGCLSDAKQAIPPDWAMWEVPLKMKGPERERLFRAGPKRGLVAMEIKLAAPKPNVPGVVLLIYQGTFPERH